MPAWAFWSAWACLLIIRGLYTALEAALQTASDAELKELASQGSIRARRVLKLKAMPEETAGTIRIGLVMAGFMAVAAGSLLIPRTLGLSNFDWLAAFEVATVFVSALVVALVAMLVDIIFRSAALQKPQAWALGLSWMGTVSVSVLTPLVTVFVMPLNLVLRAFGTKVSFQSPPPPLEELEKQLIRQAQENEVDRGAPQLIRSIFSLNEKTCRDLMVPRTEVVALPSDASVDHILQLIAEQNHSRVPVYQDDMDHIIGILHVRDLVPMLQNPHLIVLNDLLRPAVFVPWVKPIGDLLREMQQQRIHMAVVVDEYGGFSGIITLEDVLREIVGEIGDEFDEDERLVEKQADDSFLVDASLPVRDFMKTFEFHFPEGEFETLGGFLSHKAGAIPEVGERLTENGWVFIVQSKEGPRLDRIRVVKPKPPSLERRPTYERLEAVKA